MTCGMGNGIPDVSLHDEPSRACGDPSRKERRHIALVLPGENHLVIQQDRGMKKIRRGNTDTGLLRTDSSIPNMVRADGLRREGGSIDRAGRDIFGSDRSGSNLARGDGAVLKFGTVEGACGNGEGLLGCFRVEGGRGGNHFLAWEERLVAGGFGHGNFGEALLVGDYKDGVERRTGLVIAS